MDIMLDLETLGTGADAAIIQIGAVLFEPKSGGKLLNGKGFNAHVRIENGSGSIDHSTLCFWLTEPGAKAMGTNLKSALPLVEALDRFTKWPEAVGYQWSEIEGLWSNGAAFDQPILQTAYGRFGVQPPWHFRTSRCVRTLFQITGYPKVDWTGLRKHNALDDCIGQAMQVQQAMGMLANFSPQIQGIV